jgi:UDP-3-O-[3-hydroxymyristoyl] N-acetylglucosamine deacetylase/3-hydroxyacyl-[acyl-carrier-protein] dehydratase
MSGTLQRTISRQVTLDGIGVHSGESASVTFHGAAPGSGIVFRRVDLEGTPEVTASIDHVIDTELGTTVGNGDARILTVEHLLAAFSALHIDNAIVEVSGPEIPIRDGSFSDYVRALDDSVPVEQDAEAEILTLCGPVTAEGEAEQSHVATPAEGMRISATIDFDHPCIGRQYGSFRVDEEGFRRELASARTFGFKADADDLHARGLALGASLDNAVVLDETGIMNGDGLRYTDEFLRHKVGDVVGDLALLGARIDAHIVTERPSHRGNVALAREMQKSARRSGMPVADAVRIMQFLPHRYPMLLVDRIIDFEEGKSIVGLKNVTINEPFFQGHYPGHPIMPGVIIVEAMAQCGGLLLMEKVDDPETKVVYFMTMDKVKFRRPVIPGDTLVFELEVIQFRRRVCRMKGRGLVDGSVVAEAEFMARIMDR